MHFLSLVQWHHFAFLVISVAMLGFGAAGTYLALCKNWCLKNADILLPVLMISCGITMYIVVIFSRSYLTRFDTYKLLTEPQQFSRLFISYLLFFIPFFCGALAIGLIYTRHVKHVGVFYFADLTGAGIGAIVILGLLWYLIPQRIPSVVAFLPVISGTLLIPRSKKWIALSSIFSLIILIHSFYKIFPINYSEYKAISKSLLLPEASVTYEKNSPFGFTQIVSSPVMRYAPGLSLTYMQEIPVCHHIFVNGNWYAAALKAKTDTSDHILNNTTMALPYYLAPRNNVLILQSGAGAEVAQAVYNKVKRVTAVEPNTIIKPLLKKQLAGFTDSLYYQKSVRTYEVEPRSFLKQTPNHYDLINIPLIGSFGGSIGLGAIHEDYMLTVRSFREMYNLLSLKGIINISCWYDYPVRTPYRITTTIKESLTEEGIIQPQKHIAIIRSWGTITFNIKYNVFSDEEIDNIKSFCDSMGFEPIYLPDGSVSDTSELVVNIKDLILSEKDTFKKNYDFRIDAVHDNKPYFSQFLRWKNLLNSIKKLGKNPEPSAELGYIVVIFSAVQAITLALILIVLPLFRFGWKKSNTGWITLYFLGLGTGYMFLEIVFIKQFTLYLGQPMYSASLTLAIMLISSGWGSMRSSKYTVTRKLITQRCSLVAGLIAITGILTSQILPSTMGFPFYLRVMISVFAIALPSYFMGMLLPMGLKMVSHQDENKIPWAWGINGCMSVTGSVLAAVIVVEAGFLMLFLLAAFSYLLALTGSFIHKG